MATTLVKEVFHRAGILLNDLSPQFRRWTETELVFWANDGQRAIAKFVPVASSRVDAVLLAQGTRQSIAKILAASIKPGDGSTPIDVYGLALNDVVRNMGADGTVPSVAISVVARELLDAQSRAWHGSRPSRVIEHYTYDPTTPQTFYVFPPAAASTWVELNYSADPTPIPQPAQAGAYGKDGASTLAISVGDRWAEDLVNYIVARAWMKDAEHAGNGANVQLYAGLFLNSINAQVAALTGTNPNLRTLPFAPEPIAAAS